LQAITASGNPARSRASCGNLMPNHKRSHAACSASICCMLRVASAVHCAPAGATTSLSTWSLSTDNKNSTTILVLVLPSPPQTGAAALHAGHTMACGHAAPKAHAYKTARLNGPYMPWWWFSHTPPWLPRRWRQRFKICHPHVQRCWRHSCWACRWRQARRRCRPRWPAACRPCGSCRLHCGSTCAWCVLSPGAQHESKANAAAGDAAPHEYTPWRTVHDKALCLRQSCPCSAAEPVGCVV
jgi:hypothetical protein